MALTTSLTTLASKATPRKGFGGASAMWPALSSSRITPANPDASAKAPWTRTTVGPGMGSPRGWRGDPNDVTSPDPSESAQGCAARHVTGCSVPLNRHATTTCKRYRVGREAASGLGQALDPPPPTRWPIANVHADRRVSMCKSNVLYSEERVRTCAQALHGQQARCMPEPAGTKRISARLLRIRRHGPPYPGTGRPQAA